MKKTNAVLIIHGFAGNLQDHSFLEEYLKKNNYDVFTFLLPGHEKKYIRNVKRYDWLSSAEENIQKIISMGYKNIYLIGHSMGGIIASYIARNYPQVNKVVLSSPAFRCLHMNNNQRIKFNKSFILGINLLKDKEKTNSKVASRIFKVSPGTVIQLLLLMKEHRDDVKYINIPTLILHGSNDKIVPVNSSKNAYDNIPANYKELAIIKDATHPIFRTNQKEIACNLVKDFFNDSDTKKTIILNV